MSERHLITYPGFAEGKDAKGLYTDIEKIHDRKYGGNYNVHILPFYEQDEENPDSDRVIHSFARHTATLQDYMDTLDGDITVIGKCGGSRVVASMDEEHVSRTDKIALINLPWGTGPRDGLEQLFRHWNGGPLTDGEYPEGSWYIPRDDEGRRRYVVENEYMESIGDFNMIDKCQSIAHNSETRLYVVRSLRDELIPPVREHKIAGAEFIDIEGGDHHLTGASRRLALQALVEHGVLQ